MKHFFTLLQPTQGTVQIKNTNKKYLSIESSRATPPALEGSGAFDIVVMCDLLYSLSLHAPLLRTLAWLEERRGFKWLVISQAAP